MFEPPTPADLAELLANHPEAIAAWIDQAANPPAIRVLAKREHTISLSLKMQKWPGFPTIIQPAEPFNDLRAWPPWPAAAIPQQACQDEPIQLGCQVQPLGAMWVGTAGAPVRWTDPDGKTRIGILSNWHVLCVPPCKVGGPIHQPDTTRPLIANTTEWQAPDPKKPNKIDAALADASIDGFHTIARAILAIGAPCPDPLDAVKGMPVCKSGRTTGRTCGKCLATGAAVTVDYGDFTAIFEDQDVFESVGSPFAAAGDSGSLIMDSDTFCAVALLFAGNGTLTVGNPIRHVVETFKLSFTL